MKSKCVSENARRIKSSLAKILKVIFIDIDGVLNWFEEIADTSIPPHVWSPEMMRAHGFTLEVFKDKVELLNKITDATGAFLVLSSSWRKGRLVDYSEVIQYLHKEGVKGFIIGRTPWGSGMKCRGEEIEAWLNEHSNEGIERFIILDDNEDMHPLMGSLIQTDHKVGLTEEHVDLAIKMLGEKE